ncbi:MAG: hypothetical protein ACPG5B_08050 [Chitinophagales bacterium]
MKRLFLALAIMGLFAQNTYAQRGSTAKQKATFTKAEKADKSKKTPEEKAKALTDALNKEITLTKEQYSVIYKNNINIINTKIANRAARKSAMTSIGSVLTDEQKAAFKEHPKLTPTDKAEMRSSKMNEALGLDRGQYSKVVNLNKELFVTLEELRDKRETATDKRELISLKGKGKQIRESYKKQLSAILTPEQLETSKSLIGKNSEPSPSEKALMFTKFLDKKISLNIKQNSHIAKEYTNMFTEMEKQDEIRRTSKEAIAAQLTPEQAAKLKQKTKNRKKNK